VLASVAGEVVAVAVDHRQAGAHEAGEIDGGDASLVGAGRSPIAHIPWGWVGTAALTAPHDARSARLKLREHVV
jgi:hypothetical protein